MSDVVVTPDASDVVVTPDASNSLPGINDNSKSDENSLPPQEDVEEKPEEKLIETEGFRAEFLQTAVKISLPDGDSKLISYADAIPLFREFFVAKEDDGSKTKSTLLPPGVYVIEENQSYLKLGLYYQESIQNITYRSKKPLPSVVPNIVIVVVLRKSGQDLEYSSAKYYSTSLTLSEFPKQLDQLRPGISNKITWLPFTNTYDDYRMCYGANHMPRVFKNRDLREIIWYYSFLWNSPFNDDLGIRALYDYGTDYYRDHHGWYSLLADLAKNGKPFPYNYLGI